MIYDIFQIINWNTTDRTSVMMGAVLKKAYHISDNYISGNKHYFPCISNQGLREGEATQPKVTEVYFNYYDRHYFTLGEELIYYVVFDQLVTVDLSEGSPETGLLGGKKSGQHSGLLADVNPEKRCSLFTLLRREITLHSRSIRNSIELNGGRSTVTLIVRRILIPRYIISKI